MNISELMIKDWVSYHGIASRVAPADFCQKEWIDEIKPIPITPEILEKIGFEKWDDGWYIYDYENTDIEIAWVGTILKISGEYVNLELPSVMYVHQLQHALRLCGIEIEIKLRDNY
jgi:hypothetical protein